MARFRRAWIVWALVSLGLAGYVALAQIASFTTIVRLQLKPGNVTEIKLFRLLDDPLVFQLTFRATGCEQRPELGSWGSSSTKDGFLTLQSGAQVRILASTPSSAPVEYEAMPLSAYCSDQNTRTMTANLSVSPGVYHWPPPPSMPAVHLHSGFNTVRLEVESIGESISGETVNLDVIAPLGFKTARSSVIWLWFGLLWPVFIVLQSIWAAILLGANLYARRSYR